MRGLELSHRPRRYIPKVTCLTGHRTPGIGKPLPRLKFDGKLVIWPIGELRPTKRGDKLTGLVKGRLCVDAEEALGGVGGDGVLNWIAGSSSVVPFAFRISSRVRRQVGQSICIL